MGMDSFFLLRLQRASLFLHPYPERCSGLYSCWGFAPSLLKYKLPNYLQLRPAFARNICCTLSWTMFLLGLRPVLLKCKLPNYFRLCPSLFPLKRATCGDAIRSGRTFCVRTNCDDLYEEIFRLPLLIVTQSSSWQCFPTF